MQFITRRLNRLKSYIITVVITNLFKFLCQHQTTTTQLPFYHTTVSICINKTLILSSVRTPPMNVGGVLFRQLAYILPLSSLQKLVTRIFRQTKIEIS